MAYTQEGIEKPKRLVKEYLDRQGVLRVAGNELLKGSQAQVAAAEETASMER